MATRKLVPRSDNEGGIGTALLQWASGWIKLLTVLTINKLTITQPATGATLTIAEGKTLTLNASGNIPVASGSGMDFSANAHAGSTSKVLTDYEEGPWTPTITYSVSNGNTEHVIQVGSYVKIGKLVTVICNLKWTESTASGYIGISGLPFTSANVANLHNSGACCTDNLTGIVGTTVWIIAANSAAVGIRQTATGTTTTITENNTGTNSQIFFLGQYRID